MSILDVRRFLNTIPDARIARALINVLDKTAPTGDNVNLTAYAGGGQTNALLLSDACAYHEVGTVATAADSVALPVPDVGDVHIINNSATNSMQVFGADPVTVDGVATGTGVPHPGKTTAIYACVERGNYVRVSGVPSGLVATLAGITASAAEINYLDITTLGTGAASKAVVLDAGDDYTWPATGVLTYGVLKDPAATTITATGAEVNYLDIAALGTGAASKAVVLDAGDDYTWPATGVLTYGVLKDPAATTVTATGAEINYLDIAALGTGAASKAVVLDAGDDYTWPDTGVLTIGVLATATEAAEHGAGAIGTAATPTTKRWIERGGIIVTQTTVDLTGLASVALANDVIGLAAGGAAFIGRNVEATNGVIFKVEFACLETPTVGDNDVNVVANASAVLAYDGAGGTTYLSNSGDLLKGQTIENLVPALTANDYFYLTAGTGDTAGTYTAGMYVLTTYGHAVLA